MIIGHSIEEERWKESTRMPRQPHEQPLDLSTDDVQAYATLLAWKDRFLHELRTTRTVDRTLLTKFVTSVIDLRNRTQDHPERAWRLAMTEVVLAHTEWLRAVHPVLNLPDEELARLDVNTDHSEGVHTA